MLGQLGARQHLALALHQLRQQLELVTGQGKRLTSHQYAGLARVERDRPALPFGTGVFAAPAQQRAQSRQQLFHVKRLGQIVVGASVDARHLLLPGTARRQDQYRHVASGGAPAAQHRQPVKHRQAKIKNDGIELLHLAQVVRFTAIVRALHRVAGIRDGLNELGAQRRLVLDHQDAHQCLLRLIFSTCPLLASTSSLTSRPSCCNRRIS